MIFQLQELQISGMACQLYLPPDYKEGEKDYPVIYVNGEIPIEGIMTKLVNINARTDFLLLSVKPKNWNHDLTPWAAPAFRRNEEAPQGKADDYLSCLTKEIKPYIDAHYRTKQNPAHTALFGYSLGGLTAVYAIYKTDIFGTAASLSGSLWYDGFCGFMERERPLRTDLRVYLSLGKKESRSSNPRMAKVTACTERAERILTEQLEQPDSAGADIGHPDPGGSRGKRVCFEWNEGNHFHDIEGRFAKAILWWMKNTQEI